MSRPPTIDERTSTVERPVACLFTEERPSALHRRLFRRIQPYWLHCDHGLIIDLSANGIRLLSKRRLEGFVDVRLWNDRQGLAQRAEVIWSKRVGFRQWESGLQFVNYGPESTKLLAEIAAHPPI